MKKLISVAAFLAASTALASAAELVVQFGLNTSSEKQDAWEMVYGKSATDVAALDSINSANRANYAFSQTFALTSLLNTDASSFELGDSVQLTSFSLIARDNTGPGGYVTSGVYLKVSDSSGNQIALSNEIDATDVKTSDSLYGSLVFTFSDSVVLSSTESYTYSLADANGIAVSSTLGLGAFKATEGYSFSSTKLGDSEDWWRSVYKVSVAAIPEPSAFGLLAGVGALALVAARRRRRAK